MADNTINADGEQPADSAPAFTTAQQGPQLTRAAYDYMMERDIPGFLDKICAHLLAERPADPHRAVARFLLGTAAGGFRGGVAIAGENVGGGWVRVVDADGKVRAEIDRLSFAPDSGMQLLASSPRDGSILIVVNPPGTDVGVIARFGTDGRHITDYEFPKPVSCIAVDRQSGTMFVGFRGGGIWAVQHNGSKLRDMSTATPLAIRVAGDYLWVLTAKAVERRAASTGQLENAIHLPDTMNTPCSFAVATKYLWVAAPNADGTANYVGAFDYMGRTMPTYVPGSGCLIRHDARRGGIWQMTRQTNGTLSFYNERGQKVVNADLGKNKYLNVVPDEATETVWVLRVDFADDARLVMYDVMRGAAQKEIPIPGTSSAV
eukprot:CAMPEP_0174873458 /NCGR_PEP_ID=MMETSP1114-20130205/74946_1 /TAXON_ID=312471 /ORGANISM="Neobodo designis, Strain CCAP 1951/1" /LENGTH=375 /DNA_ID=CAMNT_0016108773 /DNA_START=61 /DNA_END=1185 /DNA_ORIENTATION=-